MIDGKRHEEQNDAATNEVGSKGDGRAAIMALTATALFAIFPLWGCDQARRGAQDAIRDQVAAAFDKEARSTIIGELRADFPEDYVSMRTQAADAAAEQGVAAIRPTTAKFIVGFYAAHAAQLEQAPAPALLRVVAGSLGQLVAARDISDDACVGVWAAGRLPPFIPFTPAFQSASEAYGMARVAAIRAGIDHPAGRAAATLPPQDWASVLVAASRFGVTANEINHGDQQTPSVRCQNGVAVYKALQTIAPEQAARVEAYMIYRAGHTHTN